MSTTQTPPPPDASLPPNRPERRCPRCGSALAPDQEWCLACGAAADTEIVEATGWRVPLYLGGGLAALAVLGVILAIVALSSRKEEVAQSPRPTASAIPPGATPVPTTAPLETQTPLPSVTVTPDASITPEPSTTPDPGATPEPSPTTDPGVDDGSTFPDWSGTDGWTIIIESSRTLAGAEKVAKAAEAKGLSGVGILDSSSHASLNGGYQVVFVSEFTSKSDAEDALADSKSKYPDAYVRKITG